MTWRGLLIRIGFFGLALALSAVLVSPAMALPACELPEGHSAERPGPADQATAVSVGLYLFDVIDIDDVSQQFTIDFYTEVRWTDSRLGAAVRGMDLERCETPLPTIWFPSATPLGARSIDQMLAEVAYVSADGSIETMQRSVATFSALLDLTEFPFDSQTLTVTYISLEHTPDELNIVPEWGGAAERFTEAGWRAQLGELRDGRYEVEVIRASGSGGAALSSFEFDIEATRDVTYYLWKAFFPLCLIVFTSWIVFWIDPSQLGVQSGIGTAMMLTIVAFMFSLQRIIPVVPYLTRLDIFVYSALGFVFCALLESMAASTIWAHGNQTLATRMDRWSRGLFPTAFVGVIAWFWWS